MCELYTSGVVIQTAPSSLCGPHPLCDHAKKESLFELSSLGVAKTLFASCVSQPKVSPTRGSVSRAPYVVYTIAAMSDVVCVTPLPSRAHPSLQSVGRQALSVDRCSCGCFVRVIQIARALSRWFAQRIFGAACVQSSLSSSSLLLAFNLAFRGTYKRQNRRTYGVG